jgi:PAS domain S-box-containing protein
MRAGTGSPARRGGDWLVGGGEMGRLVRAMDWSSTALGAIDSWSPGLRTTVNLTLNSNVPISLFWGPQNTQIYNDGYRPICADKHPAALGQDFTETWSSAWPVIGDAFRSALSGTIAFLQDQRMFLDRHGYLEEAFFTFSFSPIRDESGAVTGLFHPVTETTSKLVTERRTTVLRDIATKPLTAGSRLHELQGAAEALSGSGVDIPFVLIYQEAIDGRSAELVAQHGLPAGGRGSELVVDLTQPLLGWPLTQALGRNTVIPVNRVAELFPGLVCAPYPEPINTAFVLPITPPEYGGPRCVMVAGASPRLPMNEAYRSYYDMVAAVVTAVIVNATALEAERKRSDALVQIDRAKTEFFNNVSHELRTPLTMLLGPLEDELAEISDQSPSIRRERLDTVHRNGLRLLRLVDTLLDFARIEEGEVGAQYELTDLGRLTTETAATFRSACERAGLRLSVDCPEVPGGVYVDHDMWETVVLNLMSNALKFTQRGEINLSLRAGPDAVELIVRDTGVGIPQADLPRVFERFYRVPGVQSRSHEGSGIGLSFVQQLVGQHGGSVHVESGPRPGTTFTVSIPLGAGHLPPDQVGRATRDAGRALRANQSLIAEALRWAPDFAPAQPARRSTDTTVPRTASGQLPPPSSDQDERPHILWADDNLDMREYVSRLLADSYQVETVADGQAALESVRRSPPALILTDVMMPRLDGFGLLRELRADPRTQGIPVILLSARVGEETRIDGLMAGADDYLVKPFSGRELLTRVRSHVQLGQLRREAEVLRKVSDRAAAVAASETQLRLITDALPVMICYIDTDLRYRFNNRAYEEWFGFSPEELRGKKVAEVWGPELFSQVAELFERALAGEVTVHEGALPGPMNDIRYVNSTLLPDIDSDGKTNGFFGVAVDVTESKQGEAEILRLNEELEQRVAARTRELAVANEELEAFSYSVSHDLRAPLRAIDGFSQMLLQRYVSDLPAEAQRYLERVRCNAQNMASLIEALLALSGLGRKVMTKQTIDQNKLVRACLNELGMDGAGCRIDITVADLPHCSGDATLLRQVWINLLSNAFKYTRNRLTPMISIGSRSDGMETVYFCRDNGAGFDIRQIDRLFGVFQRLHSSEEFEGTGVGLAIVQRIVHRHGGRIWAEGEVGKGATFSFTIADN